MQKRDVEISKILHPKFLKCCKINAQNDIEINRAKIGEIIESIFDGKIYSFPFFDEAYCQHLCQQFEAWSNVKSKEKNKKNILLPNGLSNDGFIPQQFGYYISEIVLKVFHKIIDYLFKCQAQKKVILSEYSYLIRYKVGFDEQLKCHCDDSDITINICINPKSEKFTGSQLYFYPNYIKSETPPPPSSKILNEENKNNPLECIQYEHKSGFAVIHFGDIFHGVSELQKGKRYNLIHWMMLDTKGSNEWKRQFYDEYIDERR